MKFNGNSVKISSLGSSVKDKLEFVDSDYIQIKDLMNILDKDEMDNLLLDYQKYSWDRRSTFCGVCGSKTEYDEKENCKICPSCKERFYPAQFPAVIVAIFKDDEILLAHNVNFPDKLYSIIAGFVDLGESLEDAVRREIKEEVGLNVKNIKYFSSQNWGFTSSLMLGFTAEYESGDIVIDQVEIAKAAWFKCDNLPELPPKISIARKLIDSFIEKNRK